MEKTITIFCKNTQTYHQYPVGTTLLEIYNDLKIRLKYEVVAAYVNYKLESLNFALYKPKDIEFVDLSSSSGMRVYVRTLSMLLSKAVCDLFPNAVLKIEHPISKGYFCVIDNLEKKITPELVHQIKNGVNKLISDKKCIHTEEIQTTELIKLFGSKPNQEDKISLLKTIGTPYCQFYRIDDYTDYYNGVLMPYTDYVNLFDLVPFYDGILLRIPNRDNPVELEEIIEQPMMFEIFKEFKEWNRLMNLNNLGEFNTACSNHQSFDLIKVAEALHEKKVASIADMIAQKRPGVKFILISGPSSSGKTTFSKRLSIQLTVSGLKPQAISLDNYFVNRDLTPRDSNGDWDFEDFRALDINLFNQNLLELINGDEIEIPSYSFEEGKRYYKGNKIKLQKDSILILEGIHALNPNLVTAIPPDSIFRIYVSALTTISIDNHNWIPTSDTRLLRRIIRDYKYRSYSAKDTIARWSSVRKGEEKWIFPYQENADIMFNSALIFELAVLKKFAEPILAEVPKSCEEYAEAHRLLKFLNYFVPVYEREVPPTSLLREFVGGSSFRY